MGSDRLTRREAKRLALVAVEAAARTLALDQDDTHDGHLVAAALDEVGDELDRRAARYLQAATRQARQPDVDDLLIQLTDLGVDETTIRSRARRHRHGKHWVTWTHPDGHPDQVEASTARRAITRAVTATQKRARQQQGRAA